MKREFEVGDEVRYNPFDSREIITDINEEGEIRGGNSGVYVNPRDYTLIRRAKTMKYDQDTVRAIRECVEHHEENVEKARKAKGEFRNTFYSHKITIGETTIYYDNKHCALCKKFISTSTSNTSGKCRGIECPLRKEGYNCNKPNSVWKQIRDAKDQPQFITAEENMVRALKSLLGEEKMKYEIGNVARCKEHGTRFVIDDCLQSSTGTLYYGVGNPCTPKRHKDGNDIWGGIPEEKIELLELKEEKEMDIRKKIEGLEKLRKDAVALTARLSNKIDKLKANNV